MNFGISTACFYPELLEKSLEHARDLGYKDIEIFFNTDSEYSDSFISYINNFLKENKMRVISAHPFRLLRSLNIFSLTIKEGMTTELNITNIYFIKSPRQVVKFFSFMALSFASK